MIAVLTPGTETPRACCPFLTVRPLDSSQVCEPLLGYDADMCPHRVMPETTELMAWHCVLAFVGESCTHFRHKPRNHHGVHIGIGKQETMHHIGAGESKHHGCSGRDRDAARHKLVLLGYETHGDGPIGIRGGCAIG